MREMDDRDGPLENICIVGGGTAGWIAAATLAHTFKGRLINVTLVESEEIGSIGVGESTIPPFLQLLARFGISEPEFLREVGGTYKLGIEFRDWLEIGSRYFHPFGELGPSLGGLPFYQCWLKAGESNAVQPLASHSPAARMAAEGRFTLPFTMRGTPLQSAAYAVHVDARKAALFLRAFAERGGVHRVEGRVKGVSRRDDGGVSSLTLSDGRELEADFFIDCTGFHALFIGQTLGVSFDDWKRWLPCDRAVVAQTHNVSSPPPFTVAEAMDAGWRWQIPLQHRTGNGYVFDSSLLDDDDAKAALLSRLKGELVAPPSFVNFRTGVRSEIWSKNVLALGLSAGFVEPLESTAIHMIYRGMDFFLRYMPRRDCNPALSREYNRRMRADYEEIRDFIVLHYCTTKRSDTAFWRRCSATEVPDGLKERMELFLNAGALREGVDELFREASWISVLEGMGRRPHGHHPVADLSSGRELSALLFAETRRLAMKVEPLPSHSDFIRSICASSA